MTRTRAIAVAAVALLILLTGGLALLVATEPVAQATASPSPTPRPTPTRTPRPTPSPTPTPEPTPTPTPTPTPNPYQALLEQRVTVLLVGIDLNDDRRTRGGIMNTDAMVVASVDAAHQSVALVALPRDTVDVPLADGSIWRGKVNGLMATFGIEGLRGALATTYGIPIDYYMTIDMSDFGRLITAIGGVQVDVEKALYDGGLGLNIQPGTAVLDGNTALSYVRTRVDTDYGRNRRQQQMVVALARQLLAPNQPVNLPELAASLGSVETDIPLEALPTFMELVGMCLNAEVSTQVLGPPQFALFEGIEAGPRGWVMIPNVPEMRAYVQSVMGD